MSNTTRKFFSWGFKLLGIALAIWLLNHTVKGTDGNFAESLATASVPFLVSAVVCYGVVNLLTSWRWGVLLDVQGIHLTFWELFRLNMIGVFFSNVIPGSVSGDLVKFAYVMNRAPDKKTECALSVMVDRILGLTALLLLGAISAIVAGFIYPEIIWGNRWVRISVLCLFGLIAGDVLVLGCVAMRAQIFRIGVLKRLTEAVSKKLPGGLLAFIEKLIHAVDLYKDNPLACGKVLGVSMLVHLMLALQNCLIGKAFHEHVMTPLQYVITTQIGNITGLIPVTPGGMGLRDTLTAKLFSYFGAEPANVLGLIPVCYSIDMVLWGLFGAVLLVCGREATRE